MRVRDNAFLERLRRRIAPLASTITADSDTQHGPLVIEPWRTSPRMLKVLEITTEHLARDEGKGLIFSAYKEANDLVCNALAEHGVSAAKFDGSVRPSVRSTLIQQFQDRSQTQARLDVLVIGIKAGGESLTLDEANCVIFLNRDWTPANETQAISRADRMRSRFTQIHVHYLYSRFSIDDMHTKIMNLKTNSNPRCPSS